MNEQHLDVLIVGAGPTGLFAACEFTRRGLKCRIVEQAEAPAPWSKAQIIHARTLEIFEHIGVVNAVLAEGKQVHGTNFYATPEMKRIAHLTIEGIDSELGCFLSLPQRETERLLAQHLESLGGKIERSVRLSGFTQDDEGVTATLEHSGGNTETVRAAWLLGCDGAHSTARE